MFKQKRLKNAPNYVCDCQKAPKLCCNSDRQSRLTTAKITNTVKYRKRNFL